MIKSFYIIIQLTSLFNFSYFTIMYLFFIFQEKFFVYLHLSFYYSLLFVLFDFIFLIFLLFFSHPLTLFFPLLTLLIIILWIQFVFSGLTTLHITEAHFWMLVSPLPWLNTYRTKNVKYTELASAFEI